MILDSDLVQYYLYISSKPSKMNGHKPTRVQHLCWIDERYTPICVNFVDLPVIKPYTSDMDGNLEHTFSLGTMYT